MIPCLLCQDKGLKAIYIGESHRTWGDRQEDHEAAITEGNLKYGIVKHLREYHAEQTPKFKYEVKQSHVSAIERQISEAIMLQQTPRDIIMNSRSEWGFNFLPQQVSTKRDQLNPDRGLTISPTLQHSSREHSSHQPLNRLNDTAVASINSTPTIPPIPISSVSNPADFFGEQLNQRRKKSRIDREIKFQFLR